MRLLYHSAPVGARSKHAQAAIHQGGDFTTVPRWGRDQNEGTHAAYLLRHLPQCPGGGEIKTGSEFDGFLQVFYHSAPVGARSKRASSGLLTRSPFTTVPRWGRDQNTFSRTSRLAASLPQCPGGGEIKTTRKASPVAAAVYHSAPVGARSKQWRVHMKQVGEFTTVPRWGRDQNRTSSLSSRPPSLPQCPGGGEIKTMTHRSRPTLAS